MQAFDQIYYSKENSTQEVDFVVLHDTDIIAVEVKSEETLQSKSLKASQSSIATIFCNTTASSHHVARIASHIFQRKCLDRKIIFAETVFRQGIQLVI